MVHISAKVAWFAYLSPGATLFPATIFMTPAVNDFPRHFHWSLMRYALPDNFYYQVLLVELSSTLQTFHQQDTHCTHDLIFDQIMRLTGLALNQSG